MDALIRGELERYREWAPQWELTPAPPEMIERLEQNFADPERAWILVAEKDDELVGVVSLSLSTAVDPDAPPEGTVNLWQMFVRHDLQGSGLAVALHERALEEAGRRGYERMVLWTPEGAKQARRFYEREGWTLTGETGPDAHFGLPLVQYGRPVAG